MLCSGCLKGTLAPSLPLGLDLEKPFWPLPSLVTPCHTLLYLMLLFLCVLIYSVSTTLMSAPGGQEPLCLLTIWSSTGPPQQLFDNEYTMYDHSCNWSLISSKNREIITYGREPISQVDTSKNKGWNVTVAGRTLKWGKWGSERRGGYLRSQDSRDDLRVKCCFHHILIAGKHFWPARRPILWGLGMFKLLA